MIDPLPPGPPHAAPSGQPPERIEGDSSPSPGPPSRAGRRSVRELIAIASVTVAFLAALSVLLWPSKARTFPLPGRASSAYLNTRPNARYTGSEACRSCHAQEHASFRHTGMGISMAEVIPSRQPPDASFDHAPSKRRYQVRHKDGQLWHRELLIDGRDDETVLSEYPVKYVVGSGRHSLTYLVEADGFLVESPVTWYASRQSWGMSPGYDNPEQLGFERAADEGCLVCHAGQARAIEGSLHRVQVTEAAIGCERCHGPGSLHVDSRRRNPAGNGVTDNTIVNPARLSRDLNEAICQQCHLRPTAAVVQRGRAVAEFRPGLPIQDFIVPYVLEDAGSAMSVVGHVEQMHFSRCYQRAETLTCLTCHDPHDERRAEDRAAHFRSVCLECHEQPKCSGATGADSPKGAADDCVRCHMPQTPTDIPHLTFTHHRIGVHHDRSMSQPVSSDTTPPKSALREFLKSPTMSSIDRERSLGLAYLEAAGRETSSQRIDSLQRLALGLLTSVRSAGLEDPAVDAGLARLRFDLSLPGVEPFAESVLNQPAASVNDRCITSFLLADTRAAQGRHAEAVPALRALTRVRRHPADWLLLSDCERALGHEAAAEEALETATRIRPRLWQAHQHLAEYYRRIGNTERADWHLRRAVP